MPGKNLFDPRMDDALSIIKSALAGMPGLDILAASHTRKSSAERLMITLEFVRELPPPAPACTDCKVDAEWARVEEEKHSLPAAACGKEGGSQSGSNCCTGASARHSGESCSLAMPALGWPHSC